MAVELATAYVSLTVSAKGIKGDIERELAPLEQSAKDAGDKAGKSFSKAFSSNSSKELSDFGKKGLIATAALGAGLYGAADAAGNLQAAIAANIQILGDASDEVQDFAKHSVENVGLSERAALDAATSFGQLGKIIGFTGSDLAGFSTKLVTAAADMAAFKDVPVSQALEDLQSGFAGSTEVLRKYGIFLDEGSLKQAYFRETGETVSGVLTAQQRIVATNSEIWRQGADMWGQAEREAGGLARAQDNLKAEFENMAAALGESLVPSLTSLLSVGAKTFGVIGDLDHATGGAVGKFLAFGTAGLGLVSSLSFVAGQVGKLRDRFTELDKVNGTRTLTTTGKVAAAMGIASAAAAGASVVYGLLASDKQKIAKITQNYAQALREEESGQKDAVTAQIARDISSSKMLDTMAKLGLTEAETAAVIRGETVPAFEAIKTRIDELRKTTADVGGFNSRVRDEFNLSGLSAVDFLLQVEHLEGGLAKARDELDRFNKVQSALTGETKEASSAASSWRQHVVDAFGDAEQNGENWRKHVVSAFGDAEKAAEDQQTALDGVRDSLSDAADEALGLKAAFDKLNGKQISLEESTRAVWDGMRDIEKQVNAAKGANDEYATSLDVATQTGSDNRESIQRQVEAIKAHAAALHENGASLEEATGDLEYNRQALIDNLVQLGFTREGVEAYLDTLGLTPTSISTAIGVTGTGEALIELDNIVSRLGTIALGAEAHIKAHIDAGDIASATALANQLERLQDLGFTSYDAARDAAFANAGQPYYVPPGKAAGGPVKAGQPYIVGEHRPELFVPEVDGVILPRVPSSSSDITGRGEGDRIGIKAEQIIVQDVTDLDGLFRMANMQLAVAV